MRTQFKPPAKSTPSQINFSDFSVEHLSNLTKPRSKLSREAAVVLLGDIHREIENVEDYMLRLRWSLGFVLAHTERPFGVAREVIDDLINELWIQHKIRANRTLLYECERLYHVFSGEFPAFARWIAEQKAHLGRPLTWADIQRLCLGGRNNPDVIGREEADERDFRDAERGIEAIERIMMRAREGNEEAQGVVEGIRQSIAGLLVLANGSAVGSNDALAIPRSEEYTAFVRNHPCLVCRRPADSHHAFGRSGIGLKSSDFTCVPLCRVHHIELHRTHRAAFEADHQVDLMEVAYNLLHRYLTGTWATMVIAPHDPP